ncbi:restriction endonuclease subunit S [Photobacterium phosphoreum]|uniref:restriction endonuclease subunit S n=1 Tax=Photobacterium phosphoreum TaxID=659 RepID=UPI001E5B6450|nr:restriction endonuclease subunit S [Photobacterium phosphoreum]
MQYNKVALGNLLSVLTDYHANGAYQKLKENVELFDEEDFALMVRTTNFESNNFTGSLKFISEHAYNFLNKSKVYAGDLVMNKIANAGSIYMMPDLERPVSLAMNLFLLRIDESKANPVYVYIYLKVHEAYVKQFANGSVTKTITKDAVRNLEISLPPRVVQDQIATHYNSLSQKIDVNTRINQTLEQMAQAIFKSWFVDFDPVQAKMSGEQPEGMDATTASLFPEKLVESELGLIPDGWKVLPSEKVANVAIGKTPPRKEPQWFSEDNKDVTWISIRDMGKSGMYALDSSEYLTQESVDKFNVKVIPDNTLILSFKLTVGRVAITHGEMTTNEAIAHYKLSDDAPVSTNYLYSYMKQFNFESLGSTSSIAKAVNSKIIKALPVIVPSKDILGSFDTLVKPLFDKIKSNQIETQNLEVLRDTLLPKLLSGEIELGNAEESLND